MAVYILVQKLCQAVRVCKVNIEPGNCLDRDKAEGVGKCASRLVFIPPVNNGDYRGFPADDIMGWPHWNTGLHRLVKSFTGAFFVSCTKLPFPCTLWISPSSLSRASAWRSVIRLTPIFLDRSGSLGSCDPLGYSPLRIWA